MVKPKRYSNSRIREIIEDYVHNERNRRVLVRKYCDGRTIEQLASEFDLSESQIKRIIVNDGMVVFSIMGEK